MKQDKVFCNGCASLLVITGTVQPLCVARAGFIEGPLRKRIDVIGVIPAENRNKKNNCNLRAPVSLHAWQVKRWLVWRMNDGNSEDQKIKAKNLKEYSVGDEASNKKAFEIEERRKTEEAAKPRPKPGKPKRHYVTEGKDPRPKAKKTIKSKATVKKSTARKRKK